MRYLLDTDHIRILQRRLGSEYPTLAARIDRYPAADFAFSIVSFHEQALGAHTFIGRARLPADVVRGYRLLSEILQGFAAARVLPFDDAAAERFDDLQDRRVRLATMDLRIAATALSRGLVVLTRNVGDFGKVPGLVTENWTV